MNKQAFLKYGATKCLQRRPAEHFLFGLWADFAFLIRYEEKFKHKKEVKEPM